MKFLQSNLIAIITPSIFAMLLVTLVVSGRLLPSELDLADIATAQFAIEEIEENEDAFAKDDLDGKGFLAANIGLTVKYIYTHFKDIYYNRYFYSSLFNTTTARAPPGII